MFCLETGLLCRCKTLRNTYWCCFAKVHWIRDRVLRDDDGHADSFTEKNDSYSVEGTLAFSFQTLESAFIPLFRQVERPGAHASSKVAEGR